RVGAVGDHLACAVVFQRAGGLAQGAGGIDHVVHQYATAAFHFTDDMHHLGFVRLRAALVDDGEVGIVELLGQRAGTHHAAHVGGDHHHVLVILPFDVGHDQRCGVDVVHRNIEEALNLVGVQVDGHHAVNADGGQHVGHHLGGDGNTRGAYPAILAGVAEVRHHGGNAACGGTAQGVGQHQDLHQVVVGRVAGGLDDEHVLAAHILVNLDGDFTVAEGADVGGAQRDLQLPGHGLGQFRVGVAGKDDEFGHWRSPAGLLY